MKNITTFRVMKQKSEPIAMLTAYDYPSARYVQAAGADLILVGDTLGMVVLGYQDTLRVTVEDIIHHCRAVRRGAPDTFTIADMPYMSFHINSAETRRNALRLIREGKAQAVKLEGGKPSRLEAIREIIDCEIPVVGHLGLTPQSINAFGGYKVQGKDQKQYSIIREQALAIQEAGAFLLVLEGIPEMLGSEISRDLQIPTVGIGAGRYTNGQVLVYHDVLGMADLQPRFVKQYASLNEIITDSLRKFCQEVKQGRFPAPEHVYYPVDK